MRYFQLKSVVKRVRYKTGGVGRCPSGKSVQKFTFSENQLAEVSKDMGLMVTISSPLGVLTAHQQNVFYDNLTNATQNMRLKKFVCLGYRTASVIIALTDGELHEDLFFYSEREVSLAHFQPGNSKISGFTLLRQKTGEIFLLVTKPLSPSSDMNVRDKH